MVRDMADVAERLRLVRRASRRFLRLWAVDQAMVEPLLDRLADDLASAEPAARGPLPLHEGGAAADRH
jgi:hypothetical protein